MTLKNTHDRFIWFDKDTYDLKWWSDNFFGPHVGSRLTIEIAKYEVQPTEDRSFFCCYICVSTAISVQCVCVCVQGCISYVINPYRYNNSKIK